MFSYPCRVEGKCSLDNFFFLWKKVKNTYMAELLDFARNCPAMVLGKEEKNRAREGIHPSSLVLLVVIIVGWVLILNWGCVACHPSIALGAILGVIDLAAQTKHLATLVGTLIGAHLEGHGAVIAFVCAQLGIIDVPASSWSRHAHLNGKRKIDNVYCCFPIFRTAHIKMKFGRTALKRRNSTHQTTTPSQG